MKGNELEAYIISITGNSGLVGGDIDHEELAARIIVLLEDAYAQGIDYGVNAAGTPDHERGFLEYYKPNNHPYPQPSDTH